MTTKEKKIYIVKDVNSGELTAYASIGEARKNTIGEVLEVPLKKRPRRYLGRTARTVATTPFTIGGIVGSAASHTHTFTPPYDSATTNPLKYPEEIAKYEYVATVPPATSSSKF